MNSKKKKSTTTKLTTYEQVQQAFFAHKISYDKAVTALKRICKCTTGDAQGMVDVWEMQMKR